MATWRPAKPDSKSPKRESEPIYPWSKRRTESVDFTQQQQSLTTADIVAAQSQDYVDERELEFRQTILHLAEEQERVQKKVFTNWTNHYLAQHDPPMRVDDLIDDLRDGAKLIALIEFLSGERLHSEKGRRLRRPHFLSNVNQVLQFLERKRIKLVNINATDIVDGTPAITLGLIWTIILHFQIEEKTRMLTEQMAYMQTCGGSTSSVESGRTHSPMPDSPQRMTSSAPAAAKKISPIDRWKGGARKALLHWVKNSISQRFGIQVNDFGNSWRDGMAFLAIIHRIRPGLVNMEVLKNASNLVRLEAAFRIAEKDLGIAKLLDPEDVDVLHPDEKSIMTYVAQFLHLYPETYATADTDAIDHALSPGGDLEVLSVWLNKAESVLESRMSPGTDHRTQYYQFCTLQNELKNYRDIYERLRSKTKSTYQDMDLRAAWPNLVQRWAKVEKDLAEWQDSLDRNLPGNLGKLCCWLIAAEKRLATPLMTQSHGDSMLKVADKALDDHVEFFQPLEGHLKTLQGVQKLPQSADVLPEQVANLQERLDHVAVAAHRRQVRLQFEKNRYTILDLLSLVEKSLCKWNQKHGYEKEVHTVIKEHKEFVEQKNVFQEFDKLFAAARKNVENCQHVGALDMKETDNTEKILADVEGLWKKLIIDLHSVSNTAHQVLKHWEIYSSSVQPMCDWLNRAETVIRKDTEEQLEFFQDLPAWQEKKAQLIESGDYLGATCRDDISREIKSVIANIKARWDQLFPYLREFLASGEILRSRHQFQKNFYHLQAWLREAEGLLAKPVACKPNELESYSQRLKQVQLEWEQYDSLFKKLSKQMHSIVTHLTKPEVEKVMSSMKKEKESLLWVKTNVMSRIHILYQLIAPQDALEKGISDIDHWLGEAEKIIASYGIPSSAQAIATLQEKHKIFFSQSSSYKHQLENQNSIYKGIIEHAKSVPNLDTIEVQLKMATVNARMESCLKLSAQWENAISDAAARWQVYNETVHATKGKIQAAESLLSKKPSDAMQLQVQKEFFLKFRNENIIKDLVTTSDAVLATLLPSEQNAVKDNVKNLKSRWENVTGKFPSHLLLQEFKLKEQVFSQHMHEISRQLNMEQQMIDNGESGELIVKKHHDFFNEDCFTTANQHLAVMKSVSEEHQRCSQSQTVLNEQYCKHQKEWLDTEQKIASILSQIQKLNDEWTEYCLKFNELLGWMNEVQINIKLITDEITSADEFEAVKTKFLGICQTVDSKRDDVKWLIRKLDSLLTHIPAETGLEEQKKLDNLVTRYKSLLPEIETTIVVTETITKCFVYREEITEVNRWLKEVQTATEAVQETVCDDPQMLMQLVQQQEVYIQL